MNDLLNDPTDERLDHRLRTLMRTAVAEPPAPPSVADLDTLVSVGPEPRKEWFRPLTAVAAAVAVLAVGALVLWPSAEDDVDPADSTVPEVVAGQFLDAYYLPSELPDGWQIVGQRQDPAGSVEYPGDSVVFERRDGNERGLVSLTPVDETAPATTEAAVDVATGDTQPPQPESVADAMWNAGSGWLTWAPGGQQIVVVTESQTEASARDLAADLAGPMPSTGATLTLVDDSDWVKVKAFTYDPNGLVSMGSNSLSLATDTGQNLWISVRRGGGPTPADWLSPVAGYSDVYEYSPVPDDNLLTVTRIIGGDVLEITLRAPSADERSDAWALLAGMRPVDAQQWNDAVPDLSVAIGGLPVIKSYELLDHIVTVHFDGTIGGVCVQRVDGASSCIYLPGVDADGNVTGSFPATGFWLGDDSWVAVSSIPSGAEMCTDPQLLQGARAATVDNGGQTLVLLEAPADFTEVFACPLEGNSSDYTLYMASPPPVGR